MSIAIADYLLVALAGYMSARQLKVVELPEIRLGREQQTR
jgi:hypothetical protein